MNNSNAFLANLWRFLGLVAVQALVLRQLGTTVGEYFNVLLYPLFIFLLPMRTPTALSVFLGFAIGLTVDVMVGTIGLNASAGTWGGLWRAVVLGIYEPKGGFADKVIIPAPEHLGMQRFLNVAGTFFAGYLFWYFSVEVFAIVYLPTIILKTISGWMLSMLFVWLYCVMFNPKL